MKSMILSLIFLFNLNISVASVQPAPGEFQSRAAISAIKSYLKEIERAQAEYDKTEEDAKKQYQAKEEEVRKELIEGLETALKREIDRKNLKESVRLQETIDELKNAKPSNPGQPQIVGTWKIEWAGWPASIQTFSLERGGVLIERRASINGPMTDKGVLQWDGGIPFFKYQNETRLDRYSVVNDGRILVEQWNLTKNPDATGQPNLIGIATRVEE